MILLLGGFMPIGSSTPLVSQFLLQALDTALVDTGLATAGMNVLGGNAQRLQQTTPAGEVSGGKNTKLAKNHPDRRRRLQQISFKKIHFILE